MTKKILIVDDEESVRDAFELALEPAGYEIKTVCDGQQGVDAVKANRPDMIFLDLKMPVMDGVEALRQIKSFDSTIPVYIVTAFEMEYMDGIQRARSDGLLFNLAAKPLRPEQVVALAQSMIGMP